VSTARKPLGKTTLSPEGPAAVLRASAKPVEALEEGLDDGLRLPLPDGVPQRLEGETRRKKVVDHRGQRGRRSFEADLR
jgi:hypothetical protein